MWASVATLLEGVALLRHYLDGLAKQDALIALDPSHCGQAGSLIDETKRHFGVKNNKSRYEYNTVIVSLYGYFERCVEDLIGEYLGRLSEHATNFSELPEAVRANHMNLSLELIRRADSQRYAGSVRPGDVIGRLNRCLNYPENYELNIQAFTQHTANLRHSEIAAMLAKCGLTDIGPSMRRVEPFLDFLAREDPERDVETYLRSGDEVVFGRLDDLANRRNDVAHGTPADDLLSHDLLRERIGFVEAYVSGLALVIYERTLPLMTASALALGAAITVIDHRIVCVNLPAGRVAVGDTLIAETKDARRPFKGGRILEIERDHVQMQSIAGGPDIQIGMRVDFSAKRNHQFYVVPAAG